VTGDGKLFRPEKSVRRGTELPPEKGLVKREQFDWERNFFEGQKSHHDEEPVSESLDLSLRRGVAYSGEPLTKGDSPLGKTHFRADDLKTNSNRNFDWGLLEQYSRVTKGRGGGIHRREARKNAKKKKKKKKDLGNDQR